MEEHPTFTLRWSIEVDGAAPHATLRYELTAREELYLSDRLWDLDRTGRRIADPYGVYRFVHGRTLRLVFAQAPMPPRISLRQVYAPFSSRVRAGETHRRSVPLALPAEEYSSLARDVGSPSELDHVDRVTLVFEHRARSEMPADPLPPAREDGDAVGFIVHDMHRLVSSVEVQSLPVRRRTGYITRIALPGDAGDARSSRRRSRRRATAYPLPWRSPSHRPRAPRRPRPRRAPAATT